MPNPVYDRLAATADRLLAYYGQQATLRRIVEGAYDPATATTPTVNNDTSVRAALFGYDDNQIDGTRVLQGDRRAAIAPSLVVVPPAPGDQVLVGGETLRVISAKQINPAGKAVLYIAQVRV